MDVDIPEMDVKAADSASKRQKNLIKPPGSLGRLEDLSVRIAGMKGTAQPELSDAHILTFAGDHGIANEGVSAFPQEVTQQMVQNLANDNAAVNALAAVNGVETTVIDAGIIGDTHQNQDIISKKVSHGTNNFRTQPAMTQPEATSAIEVGRSTVIEHADSADIIGLGDMGIGNTTASAAVTAAITNTSPELVTGPGTGIDEQTLQSKVDVIDDALNHHCPDANEGIDVLRSVGGFELGAIAGAALEAAEQRIPVVIDGFNVAAGVLIAMAIDNSVTNYLLPSHQSTEPGQKVQLDALDLTPLFDLEMRLGEGTGAAIAIGMYRSACRVLCDMPTFDEAGVSR
ncbi:nicotinate-nucleotide--dimethylbenzimidazole phosphoribosyltransferase [Salinarchaeum sp. IM2453]|uniref:nicotinate-nucleotide--dimethylbenzimidazole phosphoribosyltransferase n=1 Tax=Salinarchaeum sp. IM2453 TaxID=2862870 RepID=UPI001C837435|nr:nicotinate-nucleotide--dimethylbenzimidazole phosphoribosyltransferase [Salinarchaeum sp. IM2453]QZA87841.1 nicotinate-nucleotide--dimethylbenzimidazole phosphoribosyltransferase [Salinarchaeum sp. IM2453]